MKKELSYGGSYLDYVLSLKGTLPVRTEPLEELPKPIDMGCTNTDKELWREISGDHYSDSIHVTKWGKIGIDCCGHVIVAPVRKWHKAGKLFFCVNSKVPPWKYKLAMWLLGKELLP